jgi:hypothetical protein
MKIKIETLEEDKENLKIDFQIKEEEFLLLQEEYDIYKKDLSMKPRLQNLDTDSSEIIFKLEKDNQILSNTILKLNDDKRYEIESYKKQIEDLKQKTKLLDDFHIKDDLIKTLTEKNEKYENVIISLKEEIEAFADSEKILENLTSEKYGLEDLVDELKQKIISLEEEKADLEQIHIELDEINDYNKKNSIKNEDEILRLNNLINSLKVTILEDENKQTKLLDAYNKSLKDIKILKDEILISKGNSNVKIEDIINANVNN